MGDPTQEIEVELRRAFVSMEEANQQRRRLNESFSKLDQDQAAALLNRLLTGDGTRLPSDFRRLHRAVRLELVSRLAMKLGTQALERFRVALTATGDTPLKRGLKVMFPDRAKTERDKFIRGLGAPPPSGVPTVRLEFRAKDGDTFSPDNRCPFLVDSTLRRKLVSLELGVIPGWGINQEEIRGVISGHRPDAQYKFDRIKLVKKEWLLQEDGVWRPRVPPEEQLNDRTSKNRSDEDVNPRSDHIYSMDGPGWNTSLVSFSAGGPSPVTEAVFMINFTESAMVSVGGGAWTKAGGVDWFTVTWLEKVGGEWRRKAGKNAIRAGSISNLDVVDVVPTDVSW